MSACSCDYGECLGMRIGGPFTARKKGHNCEVCGVLVKPGETCVDVAGLDGEGGGWFARFHVLCYQLLQRFKVKQCSFHWGEYAGAIDLEECAEHALAQGDDPFWKDWLLIYEMAWDYLPAMRAPVPVRTCEDYICFARCQHMGKEGKPRITRFSDPCWDFVQLRGRTS